MHSKTFIRTRNVRFEFIDLRNKPSVPSCTHTTDNPVHRYREALKAYAHFPGNWAMQGGGVIDAQMGWMHGQC